MGVNEPIEQIRNPQNAGRAAMGTELDGPAESSVNNRLRPASAHYRGFPERRLPKQLRPAQLAAGRPLTDAHLDVRGLAHFWPSSTERTQGAVAGPTGDGLTGQSAGDRCREENPVASSSAACQPNPNTQCTTAAIAAAVTAVPATPSQITAAATLRNHQRHNDNAGVHLQGQEHPGGGIRRRRSPRPAGTVRAWESGCAR